MSEIVFSVGPITSFRSLHYHFCEKIGELRSLYLSGVTPRVIYDLSGLEFKAISIGGLTALLAISCRIRQYTENPILLAFNWDPHVQGFLTDIAFFDISRRFDLFEWDERVVGGFEMGKTNPNSKLLYYADVNPQDKFASHEELNEFKRSLKQKIAPNFLLRCSNVFRGFSDRLEGVVSNTTLELIVNSLIHGESIAFVGLQRTTKRITVAVSDYGVGFPRSLNKTFFRDSRKKLSHLQGILIGTQIQKKDHGLRLAISETLDFGKGKDRKPWVVIASFDTELRFTAESWNQTKVHFDEDEMFSKAEVNEFIDAVRFPDILIGTRITFEIPLE